MRASMSDVWTWLSPVMILEVGAWVAIISILRHPREPRAMLTWIMALLLLPGVGLVLFILLGEPRQQRHRRRRHRRRWQLEAAALGRDDAFRPHHPAHLSQAISLEERRLMDLAEQLAAYPASRGNQVTIYYDAEETYQAIQSAIASAKSHIHLEYYILQPDDTGRAVRDLLIAKAREGVRCRLLLDFVGCWRLGRRFLGPLRAAGVQVAFALPVIPWRGRVRANYRNHRKIAVIDGRIGFTGSQNIGDEYRGRRAKLGPWRDTHMKIVGPAVHQLQEVFVQDWHYTTREDLVTGECFPPPETAGTHIVQMVPSGPDQEAPVMHQLLFAAVSSARSSICVITPYFVPDTSMIMAFQSASYRGVEVRLVIPARTDHPTILWAGRSYYDELDRAGVEIYEHDNTVLHSKVVIVDQSWAMVGSANMDERSFRLNYELTVILYSDDLASELYRDFEDLRARSRRIQAGDITARSFAESLLLGLSRLASPLL